MTQRADDMPEQLDWEMRIQNVQRCIEANLGRDVPLEELACVAHASMFHFHRVFRGMTHETVRAYGRRLSLERAAHRLRHDGQDILKIALDAGYNSHEAFTRAFQAHFGETPSTYRGRHSLEGVRAIAKERGGDIHVEIRRRVPVHIASVRHVGSYRDVSAAWGRLMKWGWPRLLLGKPACFGLCYDDPDITDQAQIRYDACMEVGPRTRGKGRVAILAHPGGTFAVALHSGPFENIGNTYAGLCAAIVTRSFEGKRWRLADPPSMEVYLNDPRSTRPEDLRTEVWMPVVDGR